MRKILTFILIQKTKKLARVILRKLSKITLIGLVDSETGNWSPRLCCPQPVWGGSNTDLSEHLLEIQIPGFHPSLMTNTFTLIRFLGDLCVLLFEKQFSKPLLSDAPLMRNNQRFECFQKWSWNECSCGRDGGRSGALSQEHRHKAHLIVL